MYVECVESEATHVKITDKKERADICGVTVGNIYEVIHDVSDIDEGIEEMIENDEGVFICSFTLLLDVQWLKEVNE